MLEDIYDTYFKVLVCKLQYMGHLWVGYYRLFVVCFHSISHCFLLLNFLIEY